LIKKLSPRRSRGVEPIGPTSPTDLDAPELLECGFACY
jgi:hypothetical protein